MTPDLLTRLGEIADSHDIRFGLYEPYVREAMAELVLLREVAKAAGGYLVAHDAYVAKGLDLIGVDKARDALRSAYEARPK